jgi:protein-tyrosine phosphatase
MTDLHTHILPEMDDGAPDLDTALALLALEARQGVARIALTSHYHCEEHTPEEFQALRAASWEKLKAAAEQSGCPVELKLGCEVYFSPKLRRMDCRSLCLEGTDLLLLELPVNYCPEFLEETLWDLQSQGITPLIAHVERCGYLLEDPALLARLAREGIYAQVNAQTLLRQDKRKKIVLKLLKWGLVQVICSDTHSPEKRPPRLAEAMAEIEKKLGAAAASRLEQNAKALFRGSLLQDMRIHQPKRILGSWM